MAATKLNEFSLRNVEIFKDCSEKFLQDVFALSEEVIYFPGEILRTAGTKNMHIWVVIRGKVQIVDGNNTVINSNDVVGIYSLINDLSVCVYTAYAEEKETICMRISNKSLNYLFIEFLQDKLVIVRNTLKCVNRRPRAHIMAAMEMQVGNSGRIFINGSMTNLKPNNFSNCKITTCSKGVPNFLECTELTKAHSIIEIDKVREFHKNRFESLQNKSYSTSVPNLLECIKLTKAHSTLEIDKVREFHKNRFASRQNKSYSKSVPNVLKFSELIDRRSILEIQRDRQNSLTDMHLQLNSVLIAEHANIIAQINSENSKFQTQKRVKNERRKSVPVNIGASFSNMTPQLNNARRHSTSISSGALFYSKVVLQQKSRSTTEYASIRQTSHLKLGHKLKFLNFRCMCLSCWVMVAVCVTWFSSAPMFH